MSRLGGSPRRSVHLLTKAGGKGIVNIAKGIPVLGGFIGGSVDSAGCVMVGKVANKLFKPAPA
jgi:4-diphosphocytidyl-2C-methyl-D-erythritol kinase